MTTTVLDHTSTPSIGVAFRETTEGPESELVDWFLHSSYLKAPRGSRVTVFREPRIESGFPDLVAVIWCESVTRDWRARRHELGPAEVRLVHYLHWAREATESALKPVFGRRTSELLGRLEAAGMIRKSGSRWIARSLSSIFAVREIIAFEAKVANSSAVLEQAFLNTWFASSSFILLPKPPRSTAFVEVAAARGIGVWTRAGVLHRPERDAHALPRSYASWMFNEWAWRAAQN